MIQKINLKGKLTAGVVTLLLLLILLVSIQILFYNRIPNQIAYSFSVEIPENDHNFTSDEAIYEFFSNEEDWETSRSEEWVKIEALEEDDEIWAFLRLESEGILKVGGGRRFFYDTKGPPVHPRATDLQYKEEEMVNDTRNNLQDILRAMNINVEDEEMEIRMVSFLPLLEQVGTDLYFFTYFLLFLITATISVITRSPLIPSVKGKTLDIFTTGLWYIGMVFTFFFISIIILGFYYDIFTKFYLIPGVIGSISMISGFTLNYLWYVKNGEKKVDAMGIHVIENNESCTYDREEPPKW